MASLHEQLLRIFPQVLPTDPSSALNGTDLIEKVRPLLSKDYSENSLRQHFSVLASDPTSPIAKVEQGHGYYFRPGALPDAPRTESKQRRVNGPSEDSSISTEQGRATQLEEKFRSIFLRYTELNNLFPVHIEHTKSIKRPSGVNRWKFPDVVAIQWEVGQVTDAGYQLARDLLEIKRAWESHPLNSSVSNSKLNSHSQASEKISFSV